MCVLRKSIDLLNPSPDKSGTPLPKGRVWGELTDENPFFFAEIDSAYSLCYTLRSKARNAPTRKVKGIIDSL